MKNPDTTTFFKNRSEFRNWLLNHHDSCTELWIQYYKKNSGKESLSYKEAVEEALCFGWIDGIVKSIDKEAYIQRFTPRRVKGNWSEVNIRHALRLLEEGKMHESGLKFKDRWIPSDSARVHKKLEGSDVETWESMLQQFPAASDYFHSLTATHRNQFTLWISSARRPETRRKRMIEAISTLEKGEKLGLK
ncbi:MAG: YdeI/OmpD-associated family protein [Bacteroidales bacterium]|nr:YdeI/OmpD-associated family protein [Bacteroidales bacterium]